MVVILCPENKGIIPYGHPTFVAENSQEKMPSCIQHFGGLLSFVSLSRPSANPRTSNLTIKLVVVKRAEFATSSKFMTKS